MQQELVSKQLAWTHVSDPNPEELAAFIRNSGVEPIDSDFIVQHHHRPEITIRDQYILLLIHVPVFNKKSRLTRGGALYFVITPDHLWSVSFKQIFALDKLLKVYKESDEKREEYFQDGAAGLCVNIISSMHASAFRKIERLSKYINIAEDAVFHGNERKMVEEISILARDVLDFRQIVRPQISLFSMAPAHDLVPPSVASMWQRLDGQTRKLWDLLENIFESIRELGHTNNTLLQHKENELLRLLAMYSAISIPAVILLTVYNPRSAGAGLADVITFWSFFAIYLILLLIIFFRFRGKRIL